MPKRLTPAGQAAPPVEPINTGARLPPKEPAKRTRKPKLTESGVRYVRNLHEITVRVRLNSKREIVLEPRGRREDLDVVNADEQEDPRFLANKDLLFEVIEVEAAKAIIAKQQHNSRRQGNTVWDHLKNDKGVPYEQRHARIEEAFERQGTVVGEVATPPKDGSGTSANLDFRRIGPEVVQVPGSPGHPATERMTSIPSDVDPEEYHEFLLWKQFKEQKARENEA